MSVGKRIRALRAKSGISNQEELAYLVGTARQTVSSWERDIFLPDGANLIKLSKVLNTSIAYIMGETLDPGTAERNGEKSLEGERMTAASPVYTLKAGPVGAFPIGRKERRRQDGALRSASRTLGKNAAIYRRVVGTDREGNGE